MTDKHDVLMQLVALSCNLARPENDYVIVAEGNASARIDEATFWVKASGTRMHQIDAGGFVHMALDGVLRLLDSGDLSDEEIKQGLEAAMINRSEGTRPSLEAMLHAVTLHLTPAQYVGHTHPTDVNAILCSQWAEKMFEGRLFPDEITVCGPAPAFVPYADPGLTLARRFRESLTRYLDDNGEAPRVILLQNHGLVALGRTPTEVENITAMCVKMARVLLGTFVLGGPRFLSKAEVERIRTRPDEIYREQKMRHQEGKL